jgi:hypothetical protein
LVVEHSPCKVPVCFGNEAILNEEIDLPLRFRLFKLSGDRAPQLRNVDQSCSSLEEDSCLVIRWMKLSLSSSKRHSLF